VNKVSEPADSIFAFGELQRFLAVCADAASSTRIDLGAVWQELIGGQSVIVDHFFIHDRCFAALAAPKSGAQPESRVVLKDASVLESLLLASDAQAPAVERALLDLGVCGGAAEVPLLLVMAIHAFHRGAIEAQLSELVHDGVVFRIVGVERPDARLAGTLSAAELAIARLSIEGRSLREIAARSQTSEKDAKGRLAAAFSKLGVKNRLELLSLLVRRLSDR
jgi:DNA-binding CsgD family transcriptional regulator